MIPQNIAKEVVYRVGKPRAWGDGSRRDIVINKTELNSSLFEHGRLSLY